MNAHTALAGGVFHQPSSTDDLADLRELVNEIGSRSFDARIGTRGLPDAFDASAWRHLEEAGLTRLSCTPESGGGPTELALILHALARHAVTVPVAETDLLAGWLAARAGLPVPETGPLTVAFGATSGAAVEVPYANCPTAILLATAAGDELHVTALNSAELRITAGHNLGGEPRDTVDISRASGQVALVNASDELIRRGAWARCMQTVGALDAAVESSVAHTRDRVQFGRPLSTFQSVQHTLTAMAGEVERARAAATLAVAAAADFGFDNPRTDFAVTVAKIVLGRAVHAVITAAHQLHGAIGVTIEHPLWLATMRARSWIGEFGDTAWYARKLGRLALDSAHNDGTWELIIGGPTDAQR